MKKKRSSKSESPQTVKSSTKEEFLKSVRKRNPMVEYISQLRILNPAAEITSQLNEPRREGGFVRLAHAREEFTAPVLTKGKSVSAKKKKGAKGR